MKRDTNKMTQPIAPYPATLVAMRYTFADRADINKYRASEDEAVFQPDFWGASGPLKLEKEKNIKIRCFHSPRFKRRYLPSFSPRSYRASLKSCASWNFYLKNQNSKGAQVPTSAVCTTSAHRVQTLAFFGPRAFQTNSIVS